MSAPPPASPPGEELAIYALMSVLGAIPVVLAIATRTPFGTAATLGAAMTALGSAGLIRYRSARRRS
jgi:hypothetical protein